MVHTNTISPMTFLITSSFKNRSLLPIALIALRFAVCIGKNTYTKQKILKNGTHGSHLSVNTNDTIDVAVNAKPIINGHIM